LEIKDIQNTIKKNSNEDDYNKFLKNCKYGFDNNLITLEFKNLITANFLKTTYQKKFREVFKSLLKNNVNVLFSHKTIKSKNIKMPKLSKKEQKVNFILDEAYSFNTFVVGSSNEIAYTTAKAVASNLGNQYNPLFIYGPTGLGKTHLLKAIGNEAIKNNKEVLYLTSEQFLNEFTFSLKSKNMNSFQKKYRSCDLLLIDDIQFFDSKTATQEEFFHTFNKLYENKKQIVLSADKSPALIAGLEDRLKSRFAWGISADIKSPELETKIAIIEKKSEINKINLSKEMIEYIANHLDSSIRQIEGFLFTLNANASVIHTKITLDLIKSLIKEYIKEEKKNININDIIKCVCEELNVKPSSLKSSTKVQQVVKARRVAIYLLKELTHNSMPAIAKLLNMQDHSSVSKNVKKTNELLNKNADFSLMINNLKNKIMHI
jgi:chromosomal replication initiator protein